MAVLDINARWTHRNAFIEQLIRELDAKYGMTGLSYGVTNNILTSHNQADYAPGKQWPQAYEEFSRRLHDYDAQMGGLTWEWAKLFGITLGAGDPNGGIWFVLPAVQQTPTAMGPGAAVASGTTFGTVGVPTAFAPPVPAPRPPVFASPIPFAPPPPVVLMPAPAEYILDVQLPIQRIPVAESVVSPAIIPTLTEEPRFEAEPSLVQYRSIDTRTQGFTLYDAELDITEVGWFPGRSTTNYVPLMRESVFTIGVTQEARQLTALEKANLGDKQLVIGSLEHLDEQLAKQEADAKTDAEKKALGEKRKDVQQRKAKWEKRFNDEIPKGMTRQQVLDELIKGEPTSADQTSEVKNELDKSALSELLDEEQKMRDTWQKESDKYTPKQKEDFIDRLERLKSRIVGLRDSFIESNATRITKADKDGWNTAENVEALAGLLQAEMGPGVGNADEQAGVGYTVLNRMKRNNLKSVKDVRGYADPQEPAKAMKDLATAILACTISDNTDGATHYYSPRSMPKEGEDTGGSDVKGGLEDTDGVKDKEGKKAKNYRPGWGDDQSKGGFPPRKVTGARDSHAKFARQPGTGRVQ